VPPDQGVGQQGAVSGRAADHRQLLPRHRVLAGRARAGHRGDAAPGAAHRARRVAAAARRAPGAGRQPGQRLGLLPDGAGWRSAGARLFTVNIMKAYSTELAGLQSGIRFLFCSRGDALAAQLSQALGPIGVLTQESPSLEHLARRLADIEPKVIFPDFTLDSNEPGKLLHSADLARTLARVAPEIPRVAVGLLGQPEGAIAALRAGVTDFVDPSVAPHEVREVVQRLLDVPALGAGEAGSRRDVLLIGARAGVGTSTLAAHLSGIAQERYAQVHAAAPGAAPVKPAEPGAALPLAARVALLDLGWPIGDTPPCINAAGDLDFPEATRHLQRLDATLLGSAMARTREGLGVMALPRDLAQMNHISPSDSLLVFERLRQHFGLLVTDTGGFSNMDFVAGLAR